ncbi:MAG: cytochrome c maturation protein CcmE [Acidobacteria bacterium]|nr:cytochrome c maturation protein CcmE [Acidobacteriota bacterium]
MTVGFNGDILERHTRQILMRQRAIKISLTVIVLGAAFGGLLWSTLSEGTEYYKHVDEVMVNPQAWEGKRLQLHGFVVTDSILRKRDSLEYRFKIENRGAVIPAVYSGVVPDTFKDGSEVVIKGRLTPNGFHVDPNGVMAKCPSKYEPGVGGGKVGTPGI